MPKTHLTDIAVKNLQLPATGQITYTDATLPGFGVRVSQGGARVFVLVHGTRRERLTIGRYPIISLSQARSEARRILAERTLGAHRTSSIRFKEAVQLFFTTHCDKRNKPSTAAETKRLLNRHFLPALQHEKLEEIAPQHISRIIDRLLPTPGECNHAFTAIRSFFRWAVRRHYVRHSPCAAMQLPTPPGKKDRVLTDAELVAVYRAAVTEAHPYGTIVQLLILTGQRRGEIAGLRSEYIDRDGRTIALPPSLVKNNRPHTFPVGNSAERIFAKLDTDGYLFPARGKPDRSFCGWSKSKAALDSASGITDWTLHDLRRTFATNLAALGTPPHITERLLNHATGTISGVAAIYNRHAYMDEMRAAIAAWEGRLASLLKTGRPLNRR
jgi:integrase